MRLCDVYNGLSDEFKTAECASLAIILVTDEEPTIAIENMTEDQFQKILEILISGTWRRKDKLS